ncbi:MAG: ABC transporter ATP-binding protein [Alphaproteobacteria bacterium]|nr:ABC transporter ATP-binding protein [Alphaproteobacteria bacterium]
MNSTLAFENVSAGYHRGTVLRNLDVLFAAGAVTGLVGPNGSGKTTLFRVALRVLGFHSGTVRLLDRPLSDWSTQGLARTVAYLPQEVETHWPVAARKVVALGRLPHRTPMAPLRTPDEQAIEEAMDRCDVLRFADRAMNTLSAGERAGVLLARSLAVQAPVLLADEPAAHLDPAHQLQLMELLRTEALRGTTVIVTLHDLTLASRFCDYILVLQAGSAVASGTVLEALRDDVIEAVFAIGAQRLGAAIIPWNRKEARGQAEAGRALQEGAL